MRTPSAAALLALLPSALAAPVVADSPSLDVTLAQVGNTRIKAVVKNVGSEDVSFVHLNFFKDAAPVKKVSLFSESSEVAFEGVKKRFRSKGLTKDAITSLAPGAVIEDEFDIASTSDLTKGGPITIRTSGRVPLAKDSAITGSIPYKSNELTITVDGAEAAKVAHATKNVKRTEMTQCSGEKQSALETALKNSADLATKAAAAAKSGDDARFKEYFKTTDSQTRNTVVERLQAVAKESSSTSSGNTAYYCDDVRNYCDPNVLAWTLPSENIIANCDIYYSELPPLADSCHAQDQATTSLHEFTHAPGTYSPGTDDLGYGYDAATALSAEEALNNADTYALYANAVHLDC